MNNLLQDHLQFHFAKVCPDGASYHFIIRSDHKRGAIEEKKAHPVVPGSSIYRDGGRNLKRGVGFQFFGCLELLVRIPVAVFYGLLAQRDCRDADRSQPLNALSRPPQTASSYHILGYLGQRDEPYLEL